MKINFKSCLTILVFFAFLSVNEKTLLSAQDDLSLIWYWAWVSESRTLVAYSAAGQVNTLAENIGINNLTRLDSQTGLVTLQHEDGYALYQLSPTSIFRLTDIHPGEIPIIGHNAHFKSIGFNSPYAIVVDIINEVNLLVNTETHAIELIKFSTFVFSEDGTRLRYLWYANAYRNDQNPLSREFQIRQRTLATGQDELIYEYLRSENTPKDETISCNPDKFGERWLCQKRYQDIFAQFYWSIINVNGRNQPIIEQVGDFGLFIFFTTRGIGLVDWMCKINCNIEFYTNDMSELAQYPIPDVMLPMVEHYIINYAMPINTTMIYVAAHGHHFIFENNNVIELGESLCCHGFENADESGRWITTWNLEVCNAMCLWDTYEGRLVLTLEEDVIDTNFETHAFMADGHNAVAVYDLRNFRSHIFTWKATAFTRILDFAGDNVALLWQSATTDEYPAGIYTYNVHTQIYQLVVEGTVEYSREVDEI